MEDQGRLSSRAQLSSTLVERLMHMYMVHGCCHIRVHVHIPGYDKYGK